MRWSFAGLLFLGIVAAGFAAVLVATLKAGGSVGSLSVVGPDQPITVLVATRPLSAMSVVPADAVKQTEIPRVSAPPQALTHTLQAVGKVLAVPMIEGQAFTTRSFAGEGSGVSLAAVLKPGIGRAVSVSLADYAGLNGLLYPGAHVDVLASFPLTGPNRGDGTAVSTAMLQGVEVLAVENESIVTPQDQRSTSKTTISSAANNKQWKVTLMVDTRQAKALQLAVEHGTVSLAMRNPFDDAEVDEDATMLSGGQLAKLASVLPSSIGQAVLGESAEAADPPAPADPAPVYEPPPHWDVTIIRGVKSEVRSFPIEEGPSKPSKLAAPDRTQ